MTLYLHSDKYEQTRQSVCKTFQALRLELRYGRFVTGFDRAYSSEGEPMTQVWINLQR